MFRTLKMSDAKLTDEELWQLVREDQEAAFTLLMTRYLPSLLHYGRKFSTDASLVEDCVQDVFADFWFRRATKSQIFSIRAYLFAAVRNQIGRQAREMSRSGTFQDDEKFMLFSATFSVEESWIADETERERLHKLNSIINELPPRQKEIIYLRFYQGLEKDQIAQVLEINYQSVSNLLHRALTTLRNQFPASFPVLFCVFLALNQN